MDSDQLLTAIQQLLEAWEGRMQSRFSGLEKELQVRRSYPKTIDDRLERLTERHESLTGAVEIMQIEGRRLERAVSALGRRMDDLLTLAAQHEERLHKLEGGAR